MFYSAALKGYLIFPHPWSSYMPGATHTSFYSMRRSVSCATTTQTYTLSHMCPCACETPASMQPPAHSPGIDHAVAARLDDNLSSPPHPCSSSISERNYCLAEPWWCLSVLRGSWVHSGGTEEVWKNTSSLCFPGFCFWLNEAAPRLSSQTNTCGTWDGSPAFKKVCQDKDVYL